MTAPDPPTVSFDSRYERSSGVYAVEIDGETVVYVESTEALHLLDGTASVVWGALHPTVTLGGLCDELADAFGVPPETIRSDVKPLVATLVENELIAPAN